MVMALLELVFGPIIMNYLYCWESFLYIIRSNCCNALIGSNHLYPLTCRLNCGISIIIMLFMTCFMINNQMLYISGSMASKT